MAVPAEEEGEVAEGRDSNGEDREAFVAAGSGQGWGVSVSVEGLGGGGMCTV